MMGHWTQLKPKLWFSVQASSCHKSISRKSMSQELTCSSLTKSNYSEWRSTQRLLLTSMSLMSLAPATTTFVRCVTYVHSLHLMQPKPWRFSLLAVHLIIVTVFYMACRRLTLIGYSVFKMSQWGLLHRHRGLLANISHDLHWLPVNHRITYKLCLITRKTLHLTHVPTSLN